MPVTPTQALSSIQRVLGSSSGGGGSTLSRANARRKTREIEEALADEEAREAEKKGGGGFFGGLKDLGASIIKPLAPVAEALDYSRAVAMAGVKEIGDSIDEVVGDPTGESRASFQDFKDNINRRAGLGDYLEESTLTDQLPMNVKRAIALTGDLALDPLNYVTFGASTAAKTGLRRAAVGGGDDLARVLARDGVEAGDNLLAERFAREQAEKAAAEEAAGGATKAAGSPLRVPGEPLVAAPTAPTVRDLVGRGLDERATQRSLDAIAKSGNRRMGFAGKTVRSKGEQGALADRFGISRRLNAFDEVLPAAADDGTELVHRGIAEYGDAKTIDEILALSKENNGGLGKWWGTEAEARTYGASKDFPNGIQEPGRPFGAYITARVPKGSAEELEYASGRIFNDESLLDVQAGHILNEAGEWVPIPKTAAEAARAGLPPDAIDFAAKRRAAEAAAAPTRTEATSLLGRGIERLGDSVLGQTASSIKQGAREALLPGTATRDALGETIAAAMPGITRAADALPALKLADFDRQVNPLLKKVSEEEREIMLNALDTGIEDGIPALASNPAAAQLYDVMKQAQFSSYDTLITAGKNPDELLARGQYLRHKLTEEGNEFLGITKKEMRAAAKNGKTKHRTIEGRVVDKNTRAGIAAYVTDPVELTRLSLRYAETVGGRAVAADVLEDAARKAYGVNVDDVVRKTQHPQGGFVEIAPSKFVAPEIANDWFKMSKTGDHVFLNHWDAFNGAVKRQLLFNPITAGPYMVQNAGTGISINAVDGVSPKVYERVARTLRASSKNYDEVGEAGLQARLAEAVNPVDAQYAIELRQAGVWSPTATTYDDIATNATGKAKRKINLTTGTNKTVKANQHLEETLRGAAYINARENLGMTVDEAVTHTFKRHLDYGATGKTAFERNALNRVIFFPTWLMKAPTAIVKAYAHRPGLFNQQAQMEMGEDWSTRPLTPFGQIGGSRWSGPASFIRTLPEEALTEPMERFNPLLKALVDEDSRGPTHILPPLGSVFGEKGSFADRLTNTSETGSGRLQGALFDPQKRVNYGKSLLNWREGGNIDAEYAEEKFVEGINERRIDPQYADRIASGEIPAYTSKAQLVFAALDAGMDPNDAYESTKAGLIRRLVDMGVDESRIQSVLDGEVEFDPEKIIGARVNRETGVLTPDR